MGTKKQSIAQLTFKLRGNVNFILLNVVSPDAIIIVVIILVRIE